MGSYKFPTLESDLLIFFEHQRESSANLMAAFPPRDKADFMFHWRNKILSNEKNFKKTILFNQKVAGNILCWEQDHQWLVGYWIGQEYWGKGIATHALIEFMRVLPVRPLHAYVSRENIASIRVVEKCGFSIFSQDTEEVLLVCR